MKRIFLMFTVAIMTAMMAFSGPASAQGGCKDFGQNIAGLSTYLGETFGQITAANAPANDTVEAEQEKFC